MSELIKPTLIFPKDAGSLSGPSGLGMWAKWEMELRDGERLIERREGPSHSFTKNFGKMIRGMFDHRNDVNETLTERGGAGYSIRQKSNSSLAGTDEPTISAAARIRFGNSSAALDSNQTELQGTILSLTFGTTTTTLIVEDNVQTQFRTEGQVTNSTGSSFTVEEMGLYCMVRNEANTAQDTLMLRDLTGSVVVANGLTILGRWTFTLAV